MSMQTDIQTAVVAATGTAFAGRTRVRGLLVIPGGSAGSVVLKDGGASGTIKFSIATAANGEPFSVVIPANGVLFNTDVHATLSNAAVTVMYG